MSHKNTSKGRSIKFGDPRVFFESTLTQPFDGPGGIHHDAGAIVRGSAQLEIDGIVVSSTLPSMAELLYFQASKDLNEASYLKRRALRISYVNGNHHILDEETFFRYIQLCLIGILGLYSAMEAMVYELYIRRHTTEVTISGEKISLANLSSLGFEKKITAVASQLSGKQNIYGTKLLRSAKSIAEIRTSIQHWDIPFAEDYFISLPDKHPLKRLIKVNPTELVQITREVIDHYKLGTEKDKDKK